MGVHKGWFELDPSRYRGIILISCLGRLLISLLNARLMEYVIENNGFGNNQLWGSEWGVAMVPGPT